MDSSCRIMLCYALGIKKNVRRKQHIYIYIYPENYCEIGVIKVGPRVAGCCVKYIFHINTVEVGKKKITDNIKNVTIIIMSYNGKIMPK